MTLEDRGSALVRQAVECRRWQDRERWQSDEGPNLDNARLQRLHILGQAEINVVFIPRGRFVQITVIVVRQRHLALPHHP